MRPLKPKKSIEGINRARMFIKRDLEFLTGYPGPDGRWVSQPEGSEPDSIFITRDHIHKATYTLTKLVRDFPKALPKIVGDVDKWSTLYKNLLEILKTSVHNEKPFPKSPVDVNHEPGDGEKKLYRKLLRDTPSLSNVINSFSWITFLKPETFKDALLWLDSYAPEIDKIYQNVSPADGLQMIIKLWRLSMKVGEKRLKSITVRISDPRIFEIVMDQGYQYAYQVTASLGRKKCVPIPPAPDARFGNDMMEWINWLSIQDDQTAKRSIELFDLVCDINSIENWDHWWKLLNTAIRQSEKVPRPLTRAHPLNRKLNHFREKIKKIGENPPPAVKSKLLFSLLKKWSQKDKSKGYKQISKALGILPIQYDNLPLRMVFFIYWNNLLEENNASKHGMIGHLIDEFTKHVNYPHDFRKALTLWKEVLDSWKWGENPERYIYTIDDDILDEITEKKDIPLIFEFIRKLYQDKNFYDFTRNEKRNLVLLMKLVNKEYALDYFLEFRKSDLSDEYLSSDTLKLTAEIAGDNHEYFGSILKVLLSIEERYNDITKVLQPVLKACKNSSYGTFLPDAIMGGQLRALCTTALKTGIIEYFGASAPGLPPPLHKDKNWIQRYPKELHEELIKLSFADENAEATANRILSGIFPDVNKLREEMNELVLKIEKGEDTKGFLKLRVEKLKKRLAENQLSLLPGTHHSSRPLLSEQKIRNLSKKLRHASMIGLLNRWCEVIDIHFRECLAKKLNLKEFPIWLESNKVLEIILSTAELSAAYQNIIQQILTMRASLPPWDLRDEPNNRAFIEKLTANGIDMEPWLNGTDEVIETLKNGEEVVISIERDPIEIFSMGLYFQTCLSPGGINFFSVFSNIIDINKQVVYGKTRDGIVKARALIALTDSGGILTFHPYCNDSNLYFTNILKEFVHTLAHKMHTVVLASGTVSKLLAPDWYDDGPRNLTEKFQFTLEGSDFRRKIPELDTAQLLVEMKKAVEPLGLNELTIPLFISLPELAEYPQLAAALYPYILKLKNLPSDALYQYADTLLYSENIHMLERLAPKLTDYTLKLYDRYYYWAIHRWVELLLKICPSKALIVLKKTRPKGVRSFEDDDGERIAAAGKAYLYLNRPKQAARLLSMALQNGVCSESHAFCVAELKDLKGK